MGNGDDLGLELAKALVGAAANVAVPGLGSLAMVAANGFGGREADLGEQVATELLQSLRTVGPKQKVRWRDRARAVFGSGEKKEARELLEAAGGFKAMMASAERTAEAPGEVSLAALPAAEQKSWAALAEAQLALASAPGFVPGVWQDEFAALLRGLAEDSLREDYQHRGQWNEFLCLSDENDQPGEAELTEWARTVTRVFASRMAANPELAPFVEELRRCDRDAMQYALLSSLDQQRQSLQLIAAAICALLLALGIEIDVLT